MIQEAKINLNEGIAIEGVDIKDQIIGHFHALETFSNLGALAIDYAESDYITRGYALVAEIQEKAEKIKNLLSVLESQ